MLFWLNFRYLFWLLFDFFLGDLLHFQLLPHFCLLMSIILLIMLVLVVSILACIIWVLLVLAGNDVPSESSEDGIGHLLHAFPQSRCPSPHVVDIIRQSFLGIATDTPVFIWTAVVHAGVKKCLFALSTLVNVDMRLWLMIGVLLGPECAGMVGLEVVAVAVEDSGLKGGGDANVRFCQVRLIRAKNVVVVEGGSEAQTHRGTLGQSAIVYRLSH